MNWSLMSEREKRELIAEKIMGWKKKNVTPDECAEITGDYLSSVLWFDENGRWHVEPKKWTTDLADSWEVLEKIKEKYHYIELWYDGANWWFEIGTENHFDAFAGTAPEAICKASLRSYGLDIE